MIVTLILATSCIFNIIPHYLKPTKTIKNFEACYDGQYSGLDTLVNLNGYFVRKSWRYENEKLIWESETELVFLADGTCLIEILGDGIGLERDDYINKCLDSNHAISGRYTGVYKLVGDTILMQLSTSINYVNLINWNAYESKYYIMNDTTLGYVSGKSLSRPEVTMSHSNEYRVVRSVARFIPLDAVPKYNMWIREKKYFWCEDAWPGKKAVEGIKYKNPTSFH